MSKEREALQKILEIIESCEWTRELDKIEDIATEALEQSEPRMYSEEEVKEILYHGVIQGCDHWEENGCTQRFSAEYIVNKFQSLSQESQWISVEERVSYIARVCDKHLWGLVEITATGQEPKTNIQCLYCGASKENGFKHTEPNQTELQPKEYIEADKESIELKIDDILIQQGNHPHNVRNPIYYEERECARQGFAQGRTTTIQEIEK